jgi:hypothetical protein
LNECNEMKQLEHKSTTVVNNVQYSTKQNSTVHSLTTKQTNKQTNNKIYNL